MRAGPPTRTSNPALLSPDARQLAEPFPHLVECASRAAREHDPDQPVTLIFDQRMAAQKDLAISVRNFVGGMRLPNVHPYPYFAVSHTAPGVQVADICAQVLSKRAQKIRRLNDFYELAKALQWESASKPKRYGFARFNEMRAAGRVTYEPRRTW